MNNAILESKLYIPYLVSKVTLEVSQSLEMNELDVFFINSIMINQNQPLQELWDCLKNDYNWDEKFYKFLNNEFQKLCNTNIFGRKDLSLRSTISDLKEGSSLAIEKFEKIQRNWSNNKFRKPNNETYTMSEEYVTKFFISGSEIMRVDSKEKLNFEKGYINNYYGLESNKYSDLIGFKDKSIQDFKETIIDKNEDINIHKEDWKYTDKFEYQKESIKLKLKKEDNKLLISSDSMEFELLLKKEPEFLLKQLVNTLEQEYKFSSLETDNNLDCFFLYLKEFNNLSLLNNDYYFSSNNIYLLLQIKSNTSFKDLGYESEINLPGLKEFDNYDLLVEQLIEENKYEKIVALKNTNFANKIQVALLKKLKKMNNYVLQKDLFFKLSNLLLNDFKVNLLSDYYPNLSKNNYLEWLEYDDNIFKHWNYVCEFIKTWKKEFVLSRLIFKNLLEKDKNKFKEILDIYDLDSENKISDDLKHSLWFIYEEREELKKQLAEIKKELLSSEVMNLELDTRCKNLIDKSQKFNEKYFHKFSLLELKDFIKNYEDKKETSLKLRNQNLQLQAMKTRRKFDEPFKDKIFGTHKKYLQKNHKSLFEQAQNKNAIINEVFMHNKTGDKENIELNFDFEKLEKYEKILEEANNDFEQLRKIINKLEEEKGDDK